MSSDFPDMTLDQDNLFREEVFTDQKIGTIRIMTPITIDGDRDESRELQYIGQTQVMTPAGALPLTFELEASNLKEAIAAFSEGAKQAMERTMEELREMRRQQASSIVVPGQESMGGGKIQMP
ncbi:hypothetical protein [Pleionea litopenaei]|uniref:Cytoplasmic protein n=1 Tax=Pleionea litopenaei TaxID=3070815 RepID=A0AA51RVG5_9GAMM|nr:hypothetical protein [Pleionea sp. HL-JVS1]WMS88398.1 hypothetical protein Q9312_05655 [Pleionea sp. HL-JVS1]